MATTFRRAAFTAAAVLVLSSLGEAAENTPKRLVEALDSGPLHRGSHTLPFSAPSTSGKWFVTIRPEAAGTSRVRVKLNGETLVANQRCDRLPPAIRIQVSVETMNTLEVVVSGGPRRRGWWHHSHWGSQPRVSVKIQGVVPKANLPTGVGLPVAKIKLLGKTLRIPSQGRWHYGTAIGQWTVEPPTSQGLLNLIVTNGPGGSTPVRFGWAKWNWRHALAIRSQSGRQLAPLDPYLAQNNLRAFAFGRRGSKARVRVLGYFVDQTAPTITFTDPANGALLSDPGALIRLIFADNLKLESESLRITLNGVDVTSAFSVAGGEANAALGDLPLSALAGSNVLEATIQDAACNEASATVTFVRDSTPPAFVPTPADLSVEQTSPAGALVVFPAPTVVDDFDPSPIVVCDPPSGTILPPGVSTVICTATDAAGNVSTAEFTVTVADTLDPVIGVSSPPAGACVGSAETVTVDYSDSASGVSTPSLLITLNGLDVTSSFTVGPTSATASLLTLPNSGTGPISLAVQVADQAGNTASASRSFTLDQNPPTLNLTPGNVGVTLTTGTLGLRAAYSDVGCGTVDAASFRAFLDGVEITTQFAAGPGEFNASIPFPSLGNHTFTACLTDTVGNKAIQTSSFVVSVGATQVVLTLESNGASIDPSSAPVGVSLSVRARLADASGTTASGYVGTVVLSASDGQIPLDGLVLTFTGADQGQRLAEDVVFFQNLSPVQISAATTDPSPLSGSLSVQPVVLRPTIVPTIPTTVTGPVTIRGFSYPGQVAELLVDGQVVVTQPVLGDSKFAFEVRPPSGTHAFSVRAFDSSTGTLQTSDVVTVEVIASGQVHGMVLVEDVNDPEFGRPVQGAKVRVFGTPLTTTTDPDGFFTIRDVPPGIHTILASATAQGFGAIGQSVTVAPDQLVEATSPFVLPRLNLPTATPIMLDPQNRAINTIVATSPSVPSLAAAIPAGAVVNLPPDLELPEGFQPSLSVHQVPLADVPNPFPTGLSSGFVFTVQPHGATSSGYDVTIPNVDGHPANAVVPLYQWNDALSAYEQVTTATVSVDGTTISTVGAPLTRLELGGFVPSPTFVVPLTLTGVVVNDLGAPLAGAMVSASGTATTTNASGAFSFTVTSSTSTFASLRASFTFGTGGVSRVVQATGTNPINFGTIVLSRPATITGRVIGQASASSSLLPVNLATVTIAELTVQTDPTGRFTFTNARAGSGIQVTAQKTAGGTIYTGQQGGISLPVGGSVDIGDLTITAPPPAGPNLATRTVATQGGVSTSLAYTGLEYNVTRGNFLTINAAGGDTLTEVTTPPGRFFRDISTGFPGGGTIADGIATATIADRVYVSTGNNGTVEMISPATLGGTRTQVAAGLMNGGFPRTTTDEAGNLVGLFGTNWYRVTPSATSTFLFGTPGGNQALTRSELDNTYYSGDNSQQIVQIDVGPAGGPVGTGTESVVHSISGFLGAHLRIYEPTQDFYFTSNNVAASPAGFGGNEVFAVNRSTGVRTTIYTAPAGEAVWGMDFAPNSVNPAVQSLYLLQSNRTAASAPVTWNVVELHGSFGLVFGGAVDTDGDGLSDSYENANSLNPNLADSDLDGAPDGTELLNGSSDPTDPGSVPPSFAVDVEIAPDLNVPPGASRTYTLSLTTGGSPSMLVTDRTLTITGNATFGGGANTVLVSHGGTFTVQGVNQGFATITAVGGTIPDAPFTVAVRDVSFQIDAQCAVRNCPCTACAGTADKQDGAYVNLSTMVGGFMWKCELLPHTLGRNGLSPSFHLKTNSRAHSRGGWFGTTPAMISCFERIVREGSTYVYFESEVRRYDFNLQPTPGTPSGGSPTNAVGATAQARYEVLKDTGTEIVLRKPNGTRLRFFPLDGSLTAGALKTVENRFGDQIQHTYNALGQLEFVTGVYGRQWRFSYDSTGRLEQIQEQANLRNRVVGFVYDGNNRLSRINTTPVTTTVSGTPAGIAYPTGKPYVLGYPATVTGVLATDTNIESVVFPREVLDGNNAPRFLNTYLPDDRIGTQVWGGTNASGVVAGGSLGYAYNDGAMTNTVTDRSGNVTVYTFNSQGLAAFVTEQSNRDVRGAGVDPDFVTQRTYNADQEITDLLLPAGNRVQTTFDDTDSNRYAHGNALEVRRIADARGDGQLGILEDIVVSLSYEPIFQQVRLATSARGNHPVGSSEFSPPIPDDGASTRDIDFDLNNVANDEGPTAAQNLRRRRYTSETIYDYQEGGVSKIQALALAEGISLTTGEENALSIGADLNLDTFVGATAQVVGRPVENRSPLVRLEDLSVQDIRTNMRWNSFGLLRESIDPEGHITRYTYSALGAFGTPPNATTGVALDGGYPLAVIRDAAPVLALIRTPPAHAVPGDSTSSSSDARDAVGNVIASIDARGIRSVVSVNELNQAEHVRAAFDTSGLYSNPVKEPRALPALDYETIVVYDANDNVLETHVENVVQNGTVHARVASNPWIKSSSIYDLLDNRLSQAQEVHEAGETRTIRGQTVPIDVASDSAVTTRYRYDRSQNRVLTLSPITAAVTPQSNVVASSIVDERGLPWKSSQGGVDLQFEALTTNTDINLAALGVSHVQAATFDATDTTANATATSRMLVDANGNVIKTIDPVDNGLANVGEGDPTTAGNVRGDPSLMTLDGFDRVVVNRDAMGYRSFQFYDPDSNTIGAKSVGPLGGNLQGLTAADRILASSRVLHDEVGRAYRSEVDHFETSASSAPIVPVPLTAGAPGGAVPFVSSTTFDVDGQVTRQTRPWHASDLAGARESFAVMLYDGKDRLIEQETNPMRGTDPRPLVSPSTTTFVYNDADQVIQTVEVERNVNASAATDQTFYSDAFYDAAGRQDLSVSNHFATSPLTANATRSEFDSRGNTILTTDNNSMGTAVLTITRGGGALAITVNATGNGVITAHDGLGRTISTHVELRFNKDGSAGLELLTNPRNEDALISTQRLYDANSRLVAVTDDLDDSLPVSSQNPSTTSFVFDQLNRRVRQVNADGEDQNMAFNRESQLVTREDENGTVQDRTYDDLGRTVAVGVPTVGAGVVGTTGQSFEFDGLSRTTQSADDNGGTKVALVTCTFDSLSRKTREVQSLDSASRQIDYTHDENDNVTQIEYPVGLLPASGRREINYSYVDADGTRTLDRLESVLDDAVPLATYSYEGAARVKTREYNPGVLNEGMTKTITYDALRRPTRLFHLHDVLPVDGIERLDYTYDRNGNVLSETRTVGGVGEVDIYHYDSANRRIGEFRNAMPLLLPNNYAGNPPPGTTADSQFWQLDGVGNWGQVQGSGGLNPFDLTPNSMNEYTTVSETTDPGPPTVVSRARSYDPNGNLRDTDTGAVDGGTRRLLSYDAFDRITQVQEASPTVATIGRYYYDTLGRRLGRDAGGSSLQYTFSGSNVVQEDVGGAPARQYVRGNGALLVSLSTALPALFIHENIFGSVMKATHSADPSPVQDLDYSSPGKQIFLQGDLTAQPYSYRGFRNDDETLGQFLFRSVLYEPCTGRTTVRPEGEGYGSSSSPEPVDLVFEAQNAPKCPPLRTAMSRFPMKDALARALSEAHVGVKRNMFKLGGGLYDQLVGYESAGVVYLTSLGTLGVVHQKDIAAPSLVKTTYGPLMKRARAKIGFVKACFSYHSHPADGGTVHEVRKAMRGSPGLRARTGPLTEEKVPVGWGPSPDDKLSSSRKLLPGIQHVVVQSTGLPFYSPRYWVLTRGKSEPTVSNQPLDTNVRRAPMSSGERQGIAPVRRR
tara:strand:- start:2062 stop:13272 length:11211 start_codon:yes stop_codon:yes gene_type:complete